MTKTTKLVFISGILVAFAFLTAVFIVGISLLNKNNGSQFNPGTNSTIQEQGSLILTKEEISRHNTSDDCWMIINNKIYDITQYIKSHPGGEQEILKGCGINASYLYATKDSSGQQHSQAAESLLSSFYIGDLNQNISETALNKTISEINSKSIPMVKSEDEDEKEYDDD